MNETLRKDAEQIIQASLRAVQPDAAVRRALENYDSRGGRTVLVAAGKAAWQMARAAVDALGRVDGGIVITKYGHVKGDIPGVACCEGGHPVPDENSFAATGRALPPPESRNTTVSFSGGGSALFERPRVSGGELRDITQQLLACGADIVEINTVRKRLSQVKAGQTARL